jgi:hypothetical protein
MFKNHTAFSHLGQESSKGIDAWRADVDARRHFDMPSSSMFGFLQQMHYVTLHSPFDTSWDWVMEPNSKPKVRLIPQSPKRNRPVPRTANA